ncbi:hypothetical protein Daus18300_008483 [Diaporthe australafricana]|uniref:Uncharacterized protein n=1 Tax=Diaporthe australafricana TaxID=127596 RepID=A0ABR3WIL7_9PEZI
MSSLAATPSPQVVYTTSTSAQMDNTPQANPSFSAAPPPFEFLDPAFAAMIDEATSTVSVDDYTRPWWQQSPFLVIIIIFVGMFLPALLLLSVTSYGPTSLAVQYGCSTLSETSGPKTAVFSCSGTAISKVAVLIAFVHMAVGAVCGWAALSMAARIRKRLDRWRGRRTIRQGGRRGRGEVFMNGAKKRISEHGKEVRKLNAELAKDLRWLKWQAGTNGLSWGPNARATAVANSTSRAAAVIFTLGAAHT